MKKLLSITLAVAVLMSLFCVVPASATMIGSNSIYVFEDFEDGVSSVTAEKGSLEVVDADADNGSSRVLKYTFDNTVDYADLSIPDDFGLKTGFTEDMTMRATVKYKLGKPLSKGCLTLLTNNTDDATYYSEWEMTSLTDTTKWYTAEFEIATFAKNANSAMIQLRVGNSSEYSTQAADGGDVEIYFDDLQITREKSTNKELIKMNDCRSSNYFTYGAETNKCTIDPLNSNNRVLKMTPASNGNKYNVLYFQYKDSEVTYKVGDTITVSCDILVTGEGVLPALNFRSYTTDTNVTTGLFGTNISTNSSNFSLNLYSSNKKGEWLTFTWSFVVGALGNGQFMPMIYVTSNTNTNTNDGSKVDMGYFTYYFDNLKVEVSDRSAYIVPSATNLKATMAEGGRIIPSYTYAETAVTGVTAGTDASLLKVKRANGAVVASAVAGTPLLVPEDYRSESLTLEVTPVSSTGTFGDSVITAPITAEYDIDLNENDITFTEGGVKVEVGFKHNNPDGATANVLVIICAYDSDGVLVDKGLASIVCAPGETVDTDPVADGVQNPVAEVTAANIASAKVFLWSCGGETPGNVFNTTMTELCNSISKDKPIDSATENN